MSDKYWIEYLAKKAVYTNLNYQPFLESSLQDKDKLIAKLQAENTEQTERIKALEAVVKAQREYTLLLEADIDELDSFAQWYGRGSQFIFERNDARSIIYNAMKAAGYNGEGE